MRFNVTGCSSISIGYLAGNAGTNNVSVGDNALRSNTGDNNVGIGQGVMYGNTIGCLNVAIGATALRTNTTGAGNTVVGYGALYSATNSFNVAIGCKAGCSITSGSCNVILGGYTGLTAPISGTGSGNIVFSTGNGTLRNWIDNTGIMTNCGDFRSCANITAYYSSDCRLKTNITPITGAVCKVMQISGVTYDWTEDYIKQQGGEDGYFTRKRDVGLIAQEIEKILPEIVVDRTDGYKAVKYERVVALLVEAIKELKTDFDNLSNKVNKE